MKKYFGLSIILTVGIAAFLSFSFLQTKSKKVENKKKPNILLLIVDDLKPLIGSYGDPNVKTPGIDRLASEGVLFENAYCQQAVCAPSRVSFFTGKRPDRTKVFDLKTDMRTMNPDIITAPQFFKEQGYITVGLGKLIHGARHNDPISWTIQTKDDKNLNYAKGYSYPATGKYQNPEIRKAAEEAAALNLNWRKTKKYLRDHNLRPSTECLDVPDDAYVDGAIAEAGIKLMRKLSKKNQPFFIALGFHRPHLPFVAPKKYWDMYPRDSIKTYPFQKHAANSPAYAYQSWGELRGYSDIPKQGPLPVEKQRQMIQGYWASTSYVDAQLAKVLKALDELGLDDNTIVVLWGDHGWHLGDHGLWCKHTNFEQATKVPFIIRAPGYSKDSHANGFAELVDIFPTLVDLSGMEVPDYLEGKTLVPVLKNPKKEVKDFAVSQYYRGKDKMGYTMRTDRYRITIWLNGDFKSKYLFRDPDIASIELYDYKNDPMETVSQANNPEYKEVRDRLKKQLLAFLNEQADKYTN
jgi:arylsulfatase A-like enzyme